MRHGVAATLIVQDTMNFLVDPAIRDLKVGAILQCGAEFRTSAQSFSVQRRAQNLPAIALAVQSER